MNIPASFQSLYFCLALIPANPAAGATTLVFDDFTEGGFSVSDAQRTQRERDLTLPIASNVTRIASGNSASFWIASSTAANGGNMAYDSNTHGFSSWGGYFEIIYVVAGGFDLSGYSAFSISVTNLTGKGRIMIYSNPREPGTPVDFTGTGELAVPFALMNTTAPPGSVPELTFRFIPQSNDFTITVDRIALVPEPSALLLVAAGLPLFLRRRRVSGFSGPLR